MIDNMKRCKKTSSFVTTGVMSADKNAIRTKLLELETAFKRWKRKPYSKKREQSLGVLSQQIKAQKKLLNN